MRTLTRGNRCAAIALTAVFMAGCDDSVTAPVDPALAADVAEFVQMANAHRSSNGCGELAWNTDVAAVAQAHSQDMVDRAFFDHTNPDGESPADRLNAAGVGWSSYGENIANGYYSAPAVLSAWLGSSGHRANIENCSYTQHGVGLVEGRWTHVFIRP
ncbi:MAG: CAP domain-containing protein [Gemmatimonadota bacterium]|nr:CAP domain-containing protein [Gemmatimonadota bacterium]